MPSWVIYSSCSMFALSSMRTLAAPGPGAEPGHHPPPTGPEEISLIPAGPVGEVAAPRPGGA